MIRFYKNETPVKGETVVVCIKDCSTNNIICELLEYNCMEGMICRADVSRNSTKVFRSLEPGKIIPVICSDVDIKGDRKYIDLSYATFDKTQIAHYKERYEKIIKIINIFSWIIGSSMDEFKDLEYDEYMSNSKIRSLINTIMSDSLHKMTKDEIIDTFFENTNKLHNEASSWKINEIVPNFMKKLLDKFPKPVFAMNIGISLTSKRSNGIAHIQEFFVHLNELIVKIDDKAVVTLTLESSPQYKLIIKSERITEMNFNTYFESIKNLVDNTNNRFITCKITDSKIEACNGVKIPEKIINVETGLINKAEEEEA